MKEQQNFYQKKTISKKQLETSEHKAGNLQKSRLFKKYVKHFVKAYRTAALQMQSCNSIYKGSSSKLFHKKLQNTYDFAQKQTRIEAILQKKRYI